MFLKCYNDIIKLSLKDGNLASDILRFHFLSIYHPFKINKIKIYLQFDRLHSTNKEYSQVAVCVCYTMGFILFHSFSMNVQKRLTFYEL